MSERFTVVELSHQACRGCGGMVHIRKVSCSCGHVFVDKHLVESIHCVALEP